MMTTHSEDPVPAPISTKSPIFSRLKPALILAAVLLLISPFLGSSLVYSQGTQAVIRVARGYPTELPADNQSETVLEVDYDDCTFGAPVYPNGNYTISVSTSKGQIYPAMSSTIDGGEFPPPITLKAGGIPGEAIIDVIVYYCPGGAVVIGGICSDPYYMNTSCTGSMTFTFVEADSPEENQDQPSISPTESDQGPEEAAPQESETAESEDDQEEPSLAELYDDLETFLAGEEIYAPTPGAMSATGLAVTTLLAGWLVMNQLTGVSVETSMRVIDAWRLRKPPLDPISAEAELPDDTPDLDENDDDSVGVSVPDDLEKISQVPHTPIQEGAEDRTLRGVKDAQDLDDALKQTRKDFESFESKVPDSVKNSKPWKTHVEPRIQQVKDLIKKGELDKSRTWLDRAEHLVKLRNDVDRDLDHLPADQREAIVWTERTLKVLGHFASDTYQTLVVDPAKNAGEKILPPELARKWNKAMEELNHELSNVAKDIGELPRKGARAASHMRERQQASQMMKSDSPDIREDGQLIDHTFSGYKIRPEDRFDPIAKGTAKVRELYNHTMRCLFHDR